MHVWIGAVASFTLALLAALHWSWALGAAWGKAAAIPERGGKPVFRPGKTATATVALALSFAAALVADRVGLLALPLPAALKTVSRCASGNW